MTMYEKIRTDMTDALKMGDKPRRLILADIVAAIDKAAIAEKAQGKITDLLVEQVLIKYKKTVQEMIDTCPDTEQYAARKAEYLYNMTIVNEYAPQMITDEMEIINLINEILFENEIPVAMQNKSKVMKTVMPVLKSHNCDMKIAQGVLQKMFN